MLGSSSFFQKKEQVGKAWIFGSLTKWLSSSVKELVFTHKCGSQKIIERDNQGTSPEPLVLCWVFQKAPWNWGLEQKI